MNPKIKARRDKPLKATNFTQYQNLQRKSQRETVGHVTEEKCPQYIIPEKGYVLLEPMNVKNYLGKGSCGDN